MTNTIDNAPRALKPCPFCGGEADPKGWMSSGGEQGPACDNCGATASSADEWNARAPSPAGVDGLEVVGWQQRYIDPDEGVSAWGYADARTASILQGRSDYELRPLYAVPIDAQAIIDGLRGEVEVMTQNANNYSRMFEECAEERDQQAKRIGELEGLLYEASGELRTDRHHGLRPRIETALSAGKDGSDG